MRFGELFAGIGGFSLGLERAGMKCAWQVEIDPYARAVLSKHWPDVPKHDDVRTFPPAHTHTHTQDFSVDLICGGFPCQDISVAGKGAGLAGERSGLWNDFARIIRSVRPRWVVIENVPALTARGLGTVLGDLAEIGFDAEWHCIPASAVGAPHRRERVWIVSHANSCRSLESINAKERRQGVEKAQSARDCRLHMADSKSVSGRARLRKDDTQQNGNQSGNGSGNVSHACGNGWQGCWQDGHVARSSGLRSGAWSDEEQDIPAAAAGWWESEPDVGRVAHGVPSRVDRLRCLGNAVVPQVVELIGRAIMEREAQTAATPREG